MLSTRILTALALLAGLLFVLFWLPVSWAKVTFALLMALAAWEWAGLMRQEKSARLLYAGFVLVACWELHAIGAALTGLTLLLGAFFWLLWAPLWLKHGWRMLGNDMVGYGLGLLLLMACWSAMARLIEMGPWWLLAAMAVVWVADSAAYFVGRALGRRKLAPSISPGKTWAGVYGAFCGVAVYVLLLLAFAPGSDFASRWWLMPFALLLTALSIVGDLFESLLKRQAEVKDSGSLLPGHGGVLDRIDGQLATLPLAALALGAWSA